MPATQRELYFYQGRRMSTTIGGTSARVVWGASIACAQLNIHDQIISALQCDQANTIMKNGRTADFQIYTPYGFSKSQEPTTLVTFVGQRRDKATGNYPLGNGQRDFNPRTMRFNQPDALSPFGKGGINGYSYCQSDPVNRFDPSGYAWEIFTRVGQRISKFFSRSEPIQYVPLNEIVSSQPDEVRPSVAPSEPTAGRGTPLRRIGQLAAADAVTPAPGSAGLPPTPTSVSEQPPTNRRMLLDQAQLLASAPMAIAGGSLMTHAAAAFGLGSLSPAVGVVSVLGGLYVLNKDATPRMIKYFRNPPRNR